MNPNDFTKYETARIIGARALQIAMNAPLLIKIKQEDLEAINFDALKIAEIEFKSGVLPISVHKPFPTKKEQILKRTKESKVSDEDLDAGEIAEQEEISRSGEIMEIAMDDEDDLGTDGRESFEEE